MLRYKWFRDISFLFVKDYNLINNSIINDFFLKQFVKEHGLQVIFGPFLGMKYASLEAYGSKLIPKLLGTYEHELHHIIDDLHRRKKYNRIIDIGAAEGYYTVGLAKIFEHSKVIAFESSNKARKLIKGMAMINNVASSIEIEGECTIESLKNNLDQSYSLILCDCEGFELELLDPEKIPNLLNCDIIVELHDFSYNGYTICEVMKSRFEISHFLNFINIRRNKPTSHLKNFEKEHILNLTDECRTYSVGWAFLEAKKYCLEIK